LKEDVIPSERSEWRDLVAVVAVFSRKTNDHGEIPRSPMNRVNSDDVWGCF
jgi:hypothetical protein